MSGRNRISRKKLTIHPLASVERGASIGSGTKVWQFAVVLKGARVGKDCNIGAHCFVEGGAEIGDGVTLKNDVAVWERVHLSPGVFVGPNAIFTNDVYPRSQRMPEARVHLQGHQDIITGTRVDYGATIGAGAMILAGVTIGRFATVGLGAVVTRSVPAYALAAGNPARQIGWACECGLPLRGAKRALRRCRLCRKEYKETGRQLRRVK